MLFFSIMIRLTDFLITREAFSPLMIRLQIDSDILKNQTCIHCLRIFKRNKMISKAFKSRTKDEDFSPRLDADIVLDVGEVICICGDMIWVFNFETDVPRVKDYYVELQDEVDLKITTHHDLTPISLEMSDLV